MATTLAVAAGCASSAPTVVGDDAWSSEVTTTAARRAAALPPAPRPRAIAPAQRRPWARASEVAQLDALPGRTVSEHGLGLERTVAINAAAAGYRALVHGRPLSPGALVVQRHLRSGGETVSYYVMQRLARPGPTGAWRYSVLDPALRIAAREPLLLCARCHREAPFDGLFGPPPPPALSPTHAPAPVPAPSATPPASGPPVTPPAVPSAQHFHTRDAGVTAMPESPAPKTRARRGSL